MIRVNLIGGERRSVKKKAPILAGYKMALGAGCILLMAGGVIGWRFWKLDHDSKQLDTDIAAAQQETNRLRSIIVEVQQFEQRKAQLQQRVNLIEQLRNDQTGPVHMLDELSRAMPEMLWLTEIKQSKEANEVLVDGRCTTLTGLSDFVATLEASGFFKRSIEIVSTVNEPLPVAPGEVIRFQIKAVFQPKDQPKAPPAPGRAALSRQPEGTPRG